MKGGGRRKLLLLKFEKWTKSVHVGSGGQVGSDFVPDGFGQVRMGQDGSGWV